jgi:hypothetical protein
VSRLASGERGVASGAVGSCRDSGVWGVGLGMQGQGDPGEEASARGVSVRARPAEWAEREHFAGRVGRSAATVSGEAGADMGEKVTQVMPVCRRNKSDCGRGSMSPDAGPRQRANGMPL